MGWPLCSNCGSWPANVWTRKRYKDGQPVLTLSGHHQSDLWCSKCIVADLIAESKKNSNNPLSEDTEQIIAELKNRLGETTKEKDMALEMVRKHYQRLEDLECIIAANRLSHNAYIIDANCTCKKCGAIFKRLSKDVIGMQDPRGWATPISCDEYIMKAALE